MGRIANEQWDLLVAIFRFSIEGRGVKLFYLYMVALVVYFGWFSQNVWGAGIAIGLVLGFWTGRLSEMPRDRFDNIRRKYHRSENDSKGVDSE